jgi:hypothetical protein
MFASKEEAAIDIGASVTARLVFTAARVHKLQLMGSSLPRMPPVESFI